MPTKLKFGSRAWADEKQFEFWNDSYRLRAEGTRFYLNGAIRTLAAVNGSAFVAMLAFSAAIADKELKGFSAELLISPMRFFAIGLIVAVGIAVLAGLTERLILKSTVRVIPVFPKKHRKPPSVWMIWTATRMESSMYYLLLVSFGMFTAGMFYCIELVRAIPFNN